MQEMQKKKSTYEFTYYRYYDSNQPHRDIWRMSKSVDTFHRSDSIQDTLHICCNLVNKNTISRMKKYSLSYTQVILFWHN